MTQQFQLEPPPDDLRTPLVQLKDHYVQQVIEYEKKLALALEKLAHVEALLEGWSSVEQLPLTKELPHPNPHSPTPAAPSATIAENVESDEGDGTDEGDEGVISSPPSPPSLSSLLSPPSPPQLRPTTDDHTGGDVADLESSLTSCNGNGSGAVNKSAVKTHQVNGAKFHTSSEDSSFPKLLERFVDTLDTSTRTLLSFCVDSGRIEVTDTSIGVKTLSLECPNDAVFRRLKSKLPSLVSKWNQFVSSPAIVVVSTAKNPLDTKVLSSWSKEDLAQMELVVEKVRELFGVTYTQLKHNEYSWLLIAPMEMLPPPYCEEKQDEEPFQPPASTNTLLNGSRNSSTSSEEVQGVEMLPPYQGMNRIDALSLLLAENSGTVLHLDFIVRSLYGELEPELFKVIKNRVGSSLTQGIEQKLWARVTDSPGCYTLDLSLVEPASPPQVKQSGSGRLSHPKRKSSFVKLPSLMLPPYRGQSLKAALASLIESHPGKIYCIDDFITLLFGSVEPSQKGRVRDAVIKGLSQGKREGRFESVPDSKGCYTLSISLLEAHSFTSQL